jgi:hypothetical protein
MFRPSRRAVVFAASFALAFASVAPSAHAGRSDDDDDTEEGSDALLGLIDITDLLGGLPLLGGGFDESSLPTIEGVGLPTLEALGLPGLDGLGLPALEGLGLPALDGLGLGGLGLDGIGLAGLPLGDVLSLGGVGGSSTGLPLGILDVLSDSGLDLHVLAEVGL